MERRRISLTFRTIWIIVNVIPACGQIGVTICACEPSVYTFTFNFSATCDISTIRGPGVFDSDCFARGFAIGSADDVNDTVPVQVTTVSVIELNKDLGVLAQTPYTDVFRDGDSFTYATILSTPDNITGLTSDMIPGGLQVGIVGVNQLEEPITNVWIILFDNACGIFPVLEVGDQIGWTILSDLKEPLQSVCPLAPPPVLPTLSPTTVTSSPTISPTVSTSAQPSATPTTIPSVIPTTSCPPIRRNNGSDTSVSNANTSIQKLTREQRLHHFYDPLEYEARGRGVGPTGSSPVLPPSECPEIETTIPEEQDDMHLKDSEQKPLIKKKNAKSIPEKKEKLQRPKGGADPNKSSKVKYDSDDDLSFVEIEKPTASPIEAPVILNESSRDVSFGLISPQSRGPPDQAPSIAPTTTSHARIEPRTEMIRENWKEEDATNKKSRPSMKEKNAKGNSFGQ